MRRPLQSLGDLYLEDLLPLLERGTQECVRHVLNGAVSIDRHRRGDSGALAERHENGFHPGAAVRDMARRQADGNEQV